MRDLRPVKPYMITSASRAGKVSGVIGKCTRWRVRRERLDRLLALAHVPDVVTASAWYEPETDSFRVVYTSAAPIETTRWLACLRAATRTRVPETWSRPQTEEGERLYGKRVQTTRVVVDHAAEELLSYVRLIFVHRLPDVAAEIGAGQ